jgi:L-ribulose-5-phosphate 3-epimerase
MNLNRRSFLASAAALPSAALAISSIGSSVSAADKQVVAIKEDLTLLDRSRAKAPRIKLGISTYSYWHFRTAKVPIETVIEKSSALGVEGVDILHRQMDLEEKAPMDAAAVAYCQKLKRHAFRNGLSLISLSTHQNFVSPDAAKRKANIDHTVKCLQLAHELGAPSIRLNSGRWNTIASFDDLMKARGIEPVLPGYKEDDGFKWCVDSIAELLPKAEQYGVILALENHWGLTSSPEGLLRIVNTLPASPWLGILMDTGNFLEDPYDKLRQITAKTVFVQAKTYYGGGEWYTLDLDYTRIAKILADANYAGYVSLEMEGKEDPDTAVAKSVTLLRKAFQG